MQVCTVKNGKQTNKQNIEANTLLRPKTVQTEQTVLKQVQFFQGVSDGV